MVSHLPLSHECCYPCFTDKEPDDVGHHVRALPSPRALHGQKLGLIGNNSLTSLKVKARKIKKWGTVSSFSNLCVCRWTQLLVLTQKPASFCLWPQPPVYAKISPYMKAEQVRHHHWMTHTPQECDEGRGLAGRDSEPGPPHGRESRKPASRRNTHP